MGPEYKLTAADMDGAPNELWNTFAGRLAPNANAERSEETLRKSERFKSIEKDLDATLTSINSDIKTANLIAGTKGPVNVNAFKQDAMSEIVKNAMTIKLGQENMTDDAALDQAKAAWVAEQTKLEEKGEFFDPIKNEFKTGATAVNQNVQQAYQRQIQKIKDTTIRKLETGLLESDYLAPSDNRYSERVKLLGTQFGKTPSEIVAMARQQKGLPPLEATNRELALAEMDPGQRARMASLGDATPIQMAIRAQISSGQELKGTAQQRTISVGQQMIAMGYGGLWQNPNFHYDTGYAKEGGQKVLVIIRVDSYPQSMKL
jgi:hypothetical protein